MSGFICPDCGCSASVFGHICLRPPAPAPAPDDRTLARVAEAARPLTMSLALELSWRRIPCTHVGDLQSRLTRTWGEVDALRAALAAARGEVLEEAARVCEAQAERARRQGLTRSWEDCAEWCAQLIRALGAGAATDRGADAKGGDA